VATHLRCDGIFNN